MGLSLAQKLIILVTAATMLAATQAADTIVVGGSENWRFGFNYTDWALKRGPIFVNDKLVFKYDPPSETIPPHNVYLLPNLWSFINCDFKGAKLLANQTQGGGATGFEYVLTSMWRPLYFASGEGNPADCKDGLMKFFVVPLPLFYPLSIHVVLSLISVGSKGPTLDQLLYFLNSKSNDDLNSLSSHIVSLVFADVGPIGGPLLSFANGVWVDRSLSVRSSFKQVVETVYKSALNHVDFQTKLAVPCGWKFLAQIFACFRPNLGPLHQWAIEVTHEVNQWAEKETNGLIKEVLPSGSVDHLTRIIFASALYFKGAWTQKFDASDTKDQDFHLLNGSSVQVPFMTTKKKQLVCAFNGFKVLGLPYKQGEDKREFSMYFFLPNAKDGLQALMEKVSSESGFVDRHLPNQNVEVGEFRIPKFKFSFGFEASKVLKGLGLVLPFSRGEGFTEMVDSTVSQDLYVSSIFHKSFIEVNVAAASACVVTLTCYIPEEKIDFVADHPFLFLIRDDRTSVVLFNGQVLNPLVG